MLCKAQAHVITPLTTVRKQKTIYSSLLTYLAMVGLLYKIINNLLPQPHKQFVAKYTHFISYPLVVLVWSPFFIIHGMTSEGTKHSSEILVHADMTASCSCCRFVSHMIGISCSTTSQMCSIGQPSTA